MVVLQQWGRGAIAVAVVALASTTAVAAEPRCGGTISREVTLSADLVACPGAGLRLTGAALLDCAGHTISGVGQGEGIVLDRAVGAVVRNCRVVGFKTGIRIRGGGGNRIAASEVARSARYGIELAVQSSANRIEASTITGSGDEGIHVGTGANANEIVGNDIRDNGEENVYLLSVRDCSVVGNRISGAKSANVYVKHTAGCTIADNDVEGRVVHVRGASSDNLFAGNRLHGSGFVFEAYKDAKLGWTRPRSNVVEEGAVTGAATCFRFAGAQNNDVRAVSIGGCKPVTLQRSGGFAATGNTVETIQMKGVK